MRVAAPASELRDLLTSLAEQKEEQSAFNALGTAFQCLGVRLDSQHCTLAISCCASARLWTHACWLLAAMPAQLGLRRNVVNWGAAISAARKGDQWQLALRIFGDMPSVSVERNVVTYNAAIASSRRGSEWVLALRWLNTMVTESVRCNSITFNTAMSCCEKGSQWQQSLSLLFAMQEAMVMPDVISFSSAISSCVKQGRWQVTLNLFDSMISAEIQPDIIIFGAIISSFEKGNQWQLALSFFGAMPQASVRPNDVSFNAAISSCEKGQQWQHSLMLFDWMTRASAIIPDVISFSATISSCAKGRRWEEALVLFAAMPVVKVKANIFSFSSAMTACEEGSQWQQALSLFEAIRTARLQIDLVCFNSAISSCEKGSQWREALQAFHVMDQESLRPNLVSFNAVISACGSQWHWSLRLLQLMSELRVLPDLLSFALVAEALGSRVPGTEALSSILDAMSSCTVDQLASLAPSVCRGLRRGLVPPAVSAVQRRFLNLHEYQVRQSRQKGFGVGVPKNLPAFSPEEAVEKANEMPGDEVVVKAQVLAGGRGLGHFKEKLSQGAVLWCAGAKEEENNFQGGVHIVKKEKVKEVAEKMLGKTLITKQTGAEGKPNNTVLLAEKVSIKDEKYFAILMDRSSGGPLMIGSKTGGTSIEDIAAADPTAIIKTPVDIIEGIKPEAAEKMATEMGFSGAQATGRATLMANLYKVFIECDCTMLEINPLASLTDGRVLVCDSKVNFDDNASYRQKEIHDQRDVSQENPIEVEAKKYDLNYIKLEAWEQADWFADGNVACMVNGAGLAMSTMDLLSILGGSPANFLDVGGASTVETMTMAFKIIMGDPNVKSIFVNIFGGIARCDHIAEAVVAGVKAVGGNAAIKPLVIRLEGTNVEAGMKIIQVRNEPRRLTRYLEENPVRPFDLPLHGQLEVKV
ncbi:unnamed protein product [Durusdinium trenchii]|uniref:Succinate--CoA ligase [ADP-forming] subunit beta, mitochondrial n=1 Tax=Durusdinium trenchii TaxID=1381693 RepID=A0ABP0QDK7_9DINO